MSSMQDLRGFVGLIEESGELCRIKVEVDSELEIAAITERVSKLGDGKALLFEKVKGYQLPVLTNLFGSFRRVGWALWTDHLDALAQKIARDLEKSMGRTAAERLQNLVEAPAWLSRLVKSARRWRPLYYAADGLFSGTGNRSDELRHVPGADNKRQNSRHPLG